MGLLGGWPVRKEECFLHAELAVRRHHRRSSWVVSEPYPSVKHRGLRTLDFWLQRGRGGLGGRRQRDAERHEPISGQAGVVLGLLCWQPGAAGSPGLLPVLILL